MNIRSPDAKHLIAGSHAAEIRPLSGREPAPSNQSEVDVNQSSTLALSSHQITWPIAPSRPAVTGHSFSLSGLLNILRTWEDRARFRWSLKEMASTAPHLIDDMGLTKKQVEAEIAKRFWQA